MNTLRRLHHEWRIPGLFGLVGLAVFVFVAIFGMWLAPFGAGERPGIPFSPPGDGFVLGTDDVGKDLWSQLLLGTRTSLIVGLGTAVLAISFGALIGAIAGLARGMIDTICMRCVDLVLTIPFLPLLIVASTFAGRSVLAQVLIIASLAWARPARLVRSGVLEARSHGHVEVAEAMGASRFRLLWRHLSVGVTPLLIPLFIRAAMGAILLEASLAFLGLGDPGRASWGSMLYWANSRSVYLTPAWKWWVVPPGVAISMLIVCLGLVGVGLEHKLNPERREGRR